MNLVLKTGGAKGEKIGKEWGRGKEGVERARGQEKRSISLFPSGYQQIQWPTVWLAIIRENSLESVIFSQQVQNLEGVSLAWCTSSPIYAIFLMQWNQSANTEKGTVSAKVPVCTFPLHWLNGVSATDYGCVVQKKLSQIVIWHMWWYLR